MNVNMPIVQPQYFRQTTYYVKVNQNQFVPVAAPQGFIPVKLVRLNQTGPCLQKPITAIPSVNNQIY
jgi:hypothetical protein